MTLTKASSREGLVMTAVSWLSFVLETMLLMFLMICSSLFSAAIPDIPAPASRVSYAERSK